MRIDRDRIWEIVRFYQAAAVNTAFGLGMYFLLVWLGLDKYVAQLLSHLMGMAFNYFSYSRHVFRGSAPAKGRFVLSYAANYLLGLGTLAAVSTQVANPYAAGAITMVIVSVVNYFALKFLVFRTRPA